MYPILPDEIEQVADGFPKNSKAREHIVTLMEAMNREIEAFNQEENSELQRERLRAIYRLWQTSDVPLSEQEIIANDAYRILFHKQLFHEIQNAFRKLGIAFLPEHDLSDSMGEGAASSSAAPESVVQFQTLPHFIANLSPEKVNSLASILYVNHIQPHPKASSSTSTVKSLKSRLRDLYQKDEPGYDAYQEFLKWHLIEYIGGGNSRNFKMINLLTSEFYVLKLDNRLNRSREHEMRLRSTGLDHLFVTVFATRQATYSILNDKRVPEVRTSTLRVEEYCARGSVYNEARRNGRAPDSPELFAKVIRRFEDIAQVLLEMRDSEGQCTLTDLKLSNLLINSQDNVVIGDTKSTKQFDEQGNYVPGQDGLGIILTINFIPPEYKKRNPFSLEKAQVFILGLMLYQYLSGCSHYDLPTLNSVKKADLSDYASELEILRRLPVRKDPSFLVFQDLFSACLEIDPMCRPSLTQFLESLQKIKNGMRKNIKPKGVHSIRDFREDSMAAIRKYYLSLLNGSHQSASLQKYNHAISTALFVADINHLKDEAFIEINRRYEAYKQGLFEILFNIENCLLSANDAVMEEFCLFWSNKIEDKPAPTFREKKELEEILTKLEKGLVLGIQVPEVIEALLVCQTVEDRAHAIDEMICKAGVSESDGLDAETSKRLEEYLQSEKNSFEDESQSPKGPR